MFISDNYRSQQILEQYLHSAVLQIPKHFITSKNKSIRCNLCGDSKSEPNVRSAGLVFEKDHWYYKCFREGCEANTAMSGEKWLKKTFPNLYAQYINELKLESRKDCFKRSNKTFEQKQDIKELKAEEKAKSLELKEIEDVKCFKKLNGTELSNKAREFLEAKNIDKEYWKEFYIAESGTFKNRLILPIYEPSPIYGKGDIVFWQARTLTNSPQKYLNRIGNKTEHIWGLDRIIDAYKRIFVCEGIFSAMSLEHNGIAILGSAISKIQQERINEFSNSQIIYCFDDDQAGKSAMKKLLKQGCFVLNWYQLKKHEKLPKKICDLNDLSIYLKSKITYDYLKSYITNSWFEAGVL